MATDHENKHAEPWRMRCPRGHTTWTRVDEPTAPYEYRCDSCQAADGADYRFGRLFDAAEYEFPVAPSERAAVLAEPVPACGTHAKGETDWCVVDTGAEDVKVGGVCRHCFHPAAEHSGAVLVDRAHNRPHRRAIHRVEWRSQDLGESVSGRVAAQPADD
jgi:hypothetical protein